MPLAKVKAVSNVRKVSPSEEQPDTKTKIALNIYIQGQKNRCSLKSPIIQQNQFLTLNELETFSPRKVLLVLSKFNPTKHYPSCC